MLVDFDRLVHGLRAEQLFACDRLGMDPRTYVRFVAKERAREAVS